MTPPVSSPAAATPPAATFSRHLRTLRIVLAIALVVATPLIVVLAAQQSRSGTADAYRQQARADATAVARTAADTPRPDLNATLERIRRTDAQVRGIAVYSRSGGNYRIWSVAAA